MCSHRHTHDCISRVLATKHKSFHRICNSLCWTLTTRLFYPVSVAMKPVSSTSLPPSRIYIHNQIKMRVWRPFPVSVFGFPISISDFSFLHFQSRLFASLSYSTSMIPTLLLLDYQLLKAKELVSTICDNYPLATYKRKTGVIELFLQENLFEEVHEGAHLREAKRTR